MQRSWGEEQQCAQREDVQTSQNCGSLDRLADGNSHGLDMTCRPRPRSRSRSAAAAAAGDAPHPSPQSPHTYPRPPRPPHGVQKEMPPLHSAASLGPRRASRPPPAPSETVIDISCNAAPMLGRSTASNSRRRACGHGHQRARARPPSSPSSARASEAGRRRAGGRETRARASGPFLIVVVAVVAIVVHDRTLRSFLSP